MAIRCSKQGQKSVARSLLAGVCARDPDHEAAWMWRASLAESAAQGLECLEQVLRINPNNVTAIAWLERATRPSSPAVKAPEPVVAPVRPEAVKVRPEPPAPPPVVVEKPTPVPEPAPVEVPAAEENNATISTVRLRAIMDKLSNTRPALHLEPEPEPEPTPVAVIAEPEPEPEAHAEELTCPFCTAAWKSEADTQCAACGALVIEEHPGDFARNDRLNKDVMHAAVARFSKLADGTNFEYEYRLTLAHMNLVETIEATKYARRAVALEPNDPRTDEVLKPYLAKPRVMIVDDSATIREVVTKTLEKQGYATASFQNGLYALGEVAEFKPALVLLDITMPVVDGYQVCQQLKKNPATKSIPVVMLSGKDGIFDKVKGRMAGATEYITKPFKAEYLIQAVGRHVKAAAGK